ncbi:hypothetical protein B0H17DRAFT_1127588 [Mycena rosella]|uniref:Uncharacterized protein n=1 Tax=Mycena rosella TaxID=1033263 RepID=A0AAD7E109_MYCRO|nr:hypothetical protein B0H17DRAFT_1127588 [Mycena rosella]
MHARSRRSRAHRSLCPSALFADRLRALVAFHARHAPSRRHPHELKALFERMLSVKFGIYQRPSGFLGRVLRRMFGGTWELTPTEHAAGRNEMGARKRGCAASACAQSPPPLADSASSSSSSAPGKAAEALAVERGRDNGVEDGVGISSSWGELKEISASLMQKLSSTHQEEAASEKHDADDPAGVADDGATEERHGEVDRCGLVANKDDAVEAIHVVVWALAIDAEHRIFGRSARGGVAEMGECRHSMARLEICPAVEVLCLHRTRGDDALLTCEADECEAEPDEADAALAWELEAEAELARDEDALLACEADERHTEANEAGTLLAHKLGAEERDDDGEAESLEDTAHDDDDAELLPCKDDEAVLRTLAKDTEEERDAETELLCTLLEVAVAVVELLLCEDDGDTEPLEEDMARDGAELLVYDDGVLEWDTEAAVSEAEEEAELREDTKE